MPKRSGNLADLQVNSEEPLCGAEPEDAPAEKTGRTCERRWRQHQREVYMPRATPAHLPGH